MKKFHRLLTVLLTFALALSVFCFAGSDDAAIKSAKLQYCKQIEIGSEFGSHEMRGFAVSKDGKYYYAGFLQQDRHVSKYDASTGERLCDFLCDVEHELIANSGESYPKGLAADNRGLLFVGITHPNTGYITIMCLNEDMKPVAQHTEDISGETGKTGINGIATQKIGDKILLYVLTCYNTDTIRCYDVTDVTDIKLYNEFGANGVIDYNDLTGSNADPGYIAVDTDGNIYITYLKDGAGFSKGSHVAKLSPDGKTLVKETEVAEAYGICTAGEYLFVSTSNDENSQVHVLNKDDMTEVCTLKCEAQKYKLSGIGYANDTLYVGDHGKAADGTSGLVLKAEFKITRDAAETERVDTPKLEVLENYRSAADEETGEIPDGIETSEDTEKSDSATEAVQTNKNDDSASNSVTTDNNDGGEKKDSTTTIIIIVAAVVAVVVVAIIAVTVTKKKKK